MKIQQRHTRSLSLYNLHLIRLRALVRVSLTSGIPSMFLEQVLNVIAGSRSSTVSQKRIQWPRMTSRNFPSALFRFPRMASLLVQFKSIFVRMSGRAKERAD